jgi:hypothetical protein
MSLTFDQEEYVEKDEDELGTRSKYWDYSKENEKYTFKWFLTVQQRAFCLS